jgi:hypothetical protein
MIGLIHVPEQIAGSVRRLPLHLEHRPPGAPHRLKSMLKKWRHRAPLQAREYVSSLDGVPRFNYEGVVRWARRRELTNRLSPLLVLPAALHTFGVVLRDLRREIGAGEALRFASTEAAYRAMVTAWVAWYRYVRRAR